MIRELKPLLATSRQRIKPKLAKFLKWIDSQKIEGGPGINIYRTDLGTIISSSLRSTTFIGQFKVTYANGTAKVETGFVNGIRPGNNDERLKMTNARRTWILVEVTVNENGKIEGDKKKKSDNGIKIVADEKKESGEAKIGRHPIAVIDNEKLYQLSYFSLNHSYTKGRHFFVPA